MSKLSNETLKRGVHCTANMSANKMSTVKQVKVDNWGIFFLQRLKHFFNRTDYCDLTLQFQDYAQLKVHRLVLNACTEYFELLERTCEMYEDCLIMPDDLQVDVVVPIVNFMYTGQLEYDYSLYDRLYSTAQIMNMTVLTKLLDAQKQEPVVPKPVKKEVIVMNAHLDDKNSYIAPSTSSDLGPYAKKRINSGRQYGPAPGIKVETVTKPIPMIRQQKKSINEKPRPTRYEVPEELESDDLFESSFSDISYESRPLMKSNRRNEPRAGRIRNIYDEASCSRKFEELQSSSSYKRPRLSSSEDVDSKPIDLNQVNEYAYQQKLRTEYAEQSVQSEDEIFDSLDNDNDPLGLSQKDDPNSLFSHIQDSAPNISVKQTGKGAGSNLDHAKIISEVLKKYPHLVKSNKNIKLKIMSGYDKSQSTSKQLPNKSFIVEPPKKFARGNANIKNYTDNEPDWTYVSKNMNSEAMAKLVSLGIGNTTGPWLCLLCGTPGKALNFPTYNKYYHHLAGVHKEKISANICEHCGYKSGKRNHLLHHMYTKHNIPPPSTHSFPKCNQCPYIALTEAFLIKHKLSHVDNRDFSCNVCNSSYRTRGQLLHHIQNTGHKISPDRKIANQCVYCNKMFLRETNLYTHLKLTHKEMARKDGIIDNSDEDEAEDNLRKYEDSISSYEYSGSPAEEHVNIKQEYDGKIQIISNIPVKKPMLSNQQYILNTNLMNNKALMDKSKSRVLPKSSNSIPANIVPIEHAHSSEAESLGSMANSIAASLGLVDRIVVLNENEYILQSEQEDMPLEQGVGHVQVDLDENQEVILSDLPGEEYSSHSTIEVSMPQQTTTSQIMSAKVAKVAPKTSVKNVVTRQNQPYQIVVSGNQQFKTLVSSAPLIYSTSVETITTASSATSKYVQPSTQDVQLETPQEGTVMVLQDEDFNMAHPMPSDGSNIVVVYSHPLEADGKQYVVDQSHFADLASSHEIETHVEQMEVENTEGILSEHGLVHETVETWQEENADSSNPNARDVSIQEDNQMSEEAIIHQEIPLTESGNKLLDTEDPNILSEEIRSDDIPIVTENSQIVESEPNEIVISSHEVERISCNEEETEIIDNSQQHIEGLSSEDVSTNVLDAAEITNDECAKQNEITEIHPDNVIMETEEPMEVDCSEDSELKIVNSDSEPIRADHTVKHIEKLASEWSDDEPQPREIAEQEEKKITSVVETTTQDGQIEVEESIENIEKEVQKHIQQKEKAAEVEAELANNLPLEDKDEETHVKDNEDAQDQDKNEDVQEQDKDESVLSVEDQVEEENISPDVSSSAISDNLSTPTLKQKTVEKISNLLNDWADNDSQTDVIENTEVHTENNDTQADNIGSEVEAMEVDGKKNNGGVQKDANIEKLVSDWDDDEEK